MVSPIVLSLRSNLAELGPKAKYVGSWKPRPSYERRQTGGYFSPGPHIVAPNRKDRQKKLRIPCNPCPMKPPFQRSNRGISDTICRAMLRTQLYADPNSVFVHDAVLASCR